MDALVWTMVYIALIWGGFGSGSEDFFISSDEKIYSEAELYCNQNNGTVIVFDTQEKWINFKASDLFQVSLKDENFWLGYKYQSTLCGSTGCFDTTNVAWWCSTFPETCDDVDQCVHVHQKDEKVHRKACTDQKNIAVCERGAIKSTTPAVEQTSPSTTASPVVTTSTSAAETSAAVTSTTSTPTDSSSVATSTTTTETPETSESLTTMKMVPSSTSATSTVKEITVAITTTTTVTMNQEDLLESIRKLRLQLTVKKTNTSLYRRQFTSIYESRVSSITLGSAAIVFLVFCISAIVVPDVIDMIRFFGRRRIMDSRNKGNESWADCNIG